MDMAYEGDEMRNMVSELGFSPIVLTKSSRTEPLKYDKNLYKKRNEVECLLKILNKFCPIFTKFYKLDVIFICFIVFALIVISVNRP